MHRVVACLLAVLSLPASVPAMEIGGSGSAKARIVVGARASAPARHAAAELRKYLKEVIGVELAIGSGPATSPAIYVGVDAARQADPSFSVDDLGTDGFVIRSGEDKLILAGGEPRGTLYAVYTFLEDHVGCRWWAPDAATIPKKPGLRVGELNVRQVPIFTYREPYWETALNPEWAVRNKAVGGHIRATREQGGGPGIVAASHSFYPLMPPRKYFADHPDWYTEHKGKRISEGGQLCLSNPEMVQELTRNVLARLRESRNPTQISVAQNDGGQPCQCDKCKAIDAEEGSPAGLMMRCVNAVAEQVEKEFPQVVVSTFAYTYSEPAPKITRPRPNIAVWLCTMNCSYNLPLDQHKRNENFANDLRDWSRICKRLYIWDYTTNFRHYLFIHPNLRVLGPNVRFFAAHNVKGVFEQGATGTLGAEFCELRSWVLAKLLWNPQADDNKLIDEFLDGYYGPAGREIRKYIDTLHDVMQAGRQPLGCYEEPDRKFMDIEVLTKAWSHLQAAEKAVAGDAELLWRVQRAQMPAMYAFMIRWEALRGKAKSRNVAWPMPDNPRDVLAEFKKRAEKIGIRRVSEQETFDKLEERLKLPR